MSARLPMSRPWRARRVSHHLKTLRDAEVLLSEKLGKEVYFWVNKPFLEESLRNVLSYLKESA
jgi:ArsR family transcriptional regulator